jgi:hypothetical protein
MLVTEGDGFWKASQLRRLAAHALASWLRGLLVAGAGLLAALGEAVLRGARRAAAALVMDAAMPPEPEGGDAAAAAATAAEAAANALKDNIMRRGMNSYYYAHAKSNAEVKNYGGEPQRVDGDLRALSVAPVATQGDLPSVKRGRITQYSWSDGRKIVSVYVPLVFLSGAELPEDGISLDFSATSVSLICTDASGRAHELRFPKLHEEISGAKHKRKEDSLVLVLTKATEMSWYKLLN